MVIAGMLSSGGKKSDTGIPVSLSLMAALRQWVLLLKLNTLFIVFSLPLFTIPAAYCATVNVLSDVLQGRYDEPFLLTRFLAVFRRTFKTSLIGAVVFMILEFICISSTVFYGAMAEGNILYAIFCAIGITVSMAVLVVATYFFTGLSILTGLTSKTMCVVSLYSALIKPGSAVLGIFAVFLMWLGHLLIYPFSVFFPIFISMSVGILILTFTSVKGVKLAFELVQSEKARTR